MLYTPFIRTFHYSDFKVKKRKADTFLYRWFNPFIWEHLKTRFRYRSKATFHIFIKYLYVQGTVLSLKKKSKNKGEKQREGSTSSGGSCGGVVLFPWSPISKSPSHGGPLRVNSQTKHPNICVFQGTIHWRYSLCLTIKFIFETGEDKKA